MRKIPFQGLGQRLFPKSIRRLRAELAEAEARLEGRAMQDAAQADAEALSRLARGEAAGLGAPRTLDPPQPLAMEVARCRSALRARLSRRQLEAELAELRAARDRQAARLVGDETAGFNPAACELRILEARIRDLESYLKYSHDWLRKPSPGLELLFFLGLLGATFVVVVVIDYLQT